MARIDAQFKLRLPVEIKSEVEASAKANNRTINAEILQRLGGERKAYPSQEADRFQVRMTGGLRDSIRDAAERNGRSMNAEIVQRLEAADGRTLRDWFAGQALAGCMDGRDRRQAARACYELADAMLAAREVKS